MIVMFWIYGGVAGELRSMVVLQCVEPIAMVLGQFVQERHPSCSDGTSVYNCARNNGLVSHWTFELTGNFITSIRSTSFGNVKIVDVGSAVVTLTRTSVTSNSINVTATLSYSDAVILNGTYMDCNGEKLYIKANLPGKYFLIADNNLNYGTSWYGFLLSNSFQRIL